MTLHSSKICNNFKELEFKLELKFEFQFKLELEFEHVDPS
jgi:hypothetical protein